MDSERLVSLDVLRGITVAGMILVNNPGGGSVYAPLQHALWNGLTPTDLVFPFFMFVMGFSMCFSFAKYDYRFSWRFGWKILRRTLILFALGLFFSWFSSFLRLAFAGGEPFFRWLLLPFQHLRILGVLQRLALTYFFASLIVAFVRSRPWLAGIAAGLLVVYSVILYAGNGFDFSENNIIAVVDRAVLGTNHMYQMWSPDWGTIHFDPEGLLSTLPGISHVLIGFLCGTVIRREEPMDRRLLRLALIGTTLLFLGLLLNYGCPINKKIWSPTFVLTTCGLASLLFVCLAWLIDVRQKRRWCLPFQVYGANPISLYAFATVLAIVLIRVPVGGTTLKGWLYAPIAGLIYAPCAASLTYALLYVLFVGLFGYILFRKHIYIKI